jgi:hypothetical protein
LRQPFFHLEVIAVQGQAAMLVRRAWKQVVHTFAAQFRCCVDAPEFLEAPCKPIIAPLHGAFADDIATTRRVIEAQKGPVVVGHSYGAAAGNRQVQAIVYVTALAPDAGETLGELYYSFGLGPLTTAFAPDAAGFAYIDRAKFHDLFAKDVHEPGGLGELEQIQ